MTVTVVVIEDEPAMRDLIVGYLTRRGNRVAGCGNLGRGRAGVARPSTRRRRFRRRPARRQRRHFLPGKRAPPAACQVADHVRPESDMLRHTRILVKRPTHPRSACSTSRSRCARSTTSSARQCLRCRRCGQPPTDSSITFHDAGASVASTRWPSTFTLASGFGLIRSGAALVLTALRSGSQSCRACFTTTLREARRVDRERHLLVEAAVQREQGQAILSCRRARPRA